MAYWHSPTSHFALHYIEANGSLRATLINVNLFSESQDSESLFVYSFLHMQKIQHSFHQYSFHITLHHNNISNLCNLFIEVFKSLRTFLTTHAYTLKQLHATFNKNSQSLITEVK